MSRYYVQHEGKWNIFSTIVDDFYFDDFIPFEDLKKWVLEEAKQERERWLDSLLTDSPELNVMTYREAIVTRTIREAGEQWEGEDHAFDTGINELFRTWDDSGAEPEAFVQAVKKWLKSKRDTTKSKPEEP